MSDNQFDESWTKIALAKDVEFLLYQIRLVIANIVVGGEFSTWLEEREIPWAAAREIHELEAVYRALLSREKMLEAKR